MTGTQLAVGQRPSQVGSTEIAPATHEAVDPDLVVFVGVAVPVAVAVPVVAVEVPQASGKLEQLAQLQSVTSQAAPHDSQSQSP